MRAFKHVPAQFADSFESGEQIKIGTFSYYRSFESPRGDRYEGITVVTPGPVKGDFDPGDPQQTAQARAIRSLGIVVEGTVEDVEFSGNVTTWMLPDAYLFCCSSEPDHSLLKQGLVAFEITDFQPFADEVAKVKPDILGSPVVEPVSYETREADTLVAEVPTLSPFRKSPEWAWEREIRVMWRLPAGRNHLDLDPYMILCCPAAAKFIRRIRV